MNSNKTANRNPDTTSGNVVSRANDEVYTLNIWAVGAEAATETTVRTLNNKEGHAILSNNDNTQIVNKFDDIISTMFEKYGAFDEDLNERLPEDGYEIVFTVNKEGTGVPYDCRFERGEVTLHLTPEHTPDMVSTVDRILSQLED